MKFKTFLQERKKTVKKTVYFDMDGVIADFNGSYMKHFNKDASGFAIPDDELWPNILSVENYWEDLEFMLGTLPVWKYAMENANVEILSAYSSHDRRSVNGKKVWLKKHKDKLGKGFKINLVKAYEKQQFANENSILIDDLENNIKQFNAKGGKGILFKNGPQALKELKKVL